jgi:hypothetical protein
METTQQFYRVDRRQISMIRFVFEAYEGLAVVTTLDPRAGVIALSIAPGCEAMASAIMQDLSGDFPIEPIRRPTILSAALPRGERLGEGL